MGLKETTSKFEMGDPTTTVSAEVHPYLLFVLNASDWIVFGIYVNNGPLTAISPFGRTCSGDIAQCERDEKYVPVFMTPCNEGAYSLALALRDPRNGREYKTRPITVKPDCGYRGEMAILNLPLP